MCGVFILMILWVIGCVVPPSTTIVLIDLGIGGVGEALETSAGQSRAMMSWMLTERAKSAKRWGTRWVVAPLAVAMAIMCMGGWTVSVVGVVEYQCPGGMKPAHSFPMSIVAMSRTLGSVRWRMWGASGSLLGINMIMHVVDSGRAVTLPRACLTALSFASGQSPMYAWHAPVHGREKAS